MVRTITALLFALILFGIPGSANTQAWLDVRQTDSAYFTLAASGVLDYPADGDLTVAATDAIVLPPDASTVLPRLTEPSIFIMMVLGVCVLGYRSRGSTTETFH
jgi:hypothetical protein